MTWIRSAGVLLMVLLKHSPPTVKALKRPYAQRLWGLCEVFFGSPRATTGDRAATSASEERPSRSPAADRLPGVLTRAEPTADSGVRPGSSLLTSVPIRATNGGSEGSVQSRRRRAGCG